MYECIVYDESKINKVSHDTLIASRDQSSYTLSEEKESLDVYSNKQMKEIVIYEIKQRCLIFIVAYLESTKHLICSSL